MGNTDSTPVDKEETCECGKPIEESCQFEGKYNAKLVGTMKKDYNRHFIICSGSMDWEQPKPEKTPGTFANDFMKAIKNLNIPEDKPSPLFTLCSEPNTTEEGTDVVVYPEGIKYIGLKASDLELFVKKQVEEGVVCTELKSEPVTWGHLVLVCTHGTRDKRCGRIGPQVVDQLKKMLDEKGLTEGKDVAVRGSSHLGGHKYAAVVVVYPEGDWYGQMTAKNANDLLDAYTKHKVIYAPGFRGKMGESMDQSKARVAAPTSQTI
eukprot:TRINITY_DN1648_c0_g1_i4.p1 TRINITY_DN1648_c0_g1~~TRINITY_DN1648_c0_g1_i4.p1  ORF type:complete len:264 (+),score=69.67 TRINITY_DN1648_c0_g1_i4:213-1004(+)